MLYLIRYRDGFGNTHTTTLGAMNRKDARYLAKQQPTVNHEVFSRFTVVELPEFRIVHEIDGQRVIATTLKNQPEGHVNYVFTDATQGGRLVASVEFINAKGRAFYALRWVDELTLAA